MPKRPAEVGPKKIKGIASVAYLIRVGRRNCIRRGQRTNRSVSNEGIREPSCEKPSKEISIVVVNLSTEVALHQRRRCRAIQILRRDNRRPAIDSIQAEATTLIGPT